MGWGSAPTSFVTVGENVSVRNCWHAVRARVIGSPECAPLFQPDPKQVKSIYWHNLVITDIIDNLYMPRNAPSFWRLNVSLLREGGRPHTWESASFSRPLGPNHRLYKNQIDSGIWSISIPHRWNSVHANGKDPFSDGGCKNRNIWRIFKVITNRNILRKIMTFHWISWRHTNPTKCLT